MKSELQVVVFDTKPEVVAVLTDRFLRSGYVDVFQGSGPSASAKFDLDALWLTGMQITYFDVPPILATAAKVVECSLELRRMGFPPLIVAGWLMPEDIENDPASFGERYQQLMFDAVDGFNSNAERPLQRIGSIPENLGVGGHSLDTVIRSSEALMAELESRGEQAHRTYNPAFQHVSLGR